MKNLLLSSVVSLFLFSCTLGHYGRLIKSTDKQEFPKSIFAENSNSYLFKTNVTVYGKEISGLLIAKQVEPNDYRIVFTNEMGIKYFDFEINDTATILHYCVPQFNRPALLRTIQQDISILLMNNIKGKEIAGYTDKQKIYTIQKIEVDGFYNYYFTESNTQHIVKIEHSKKLFKKTIFTLSNYQANFPNTILIKHCDIKLTMELNYLKR